MDEKGARQGGWVSCLRSETAHLTLTHIGLDSIKAFFFFFLSSVHSFKRHALNTTEARPRPTTGKGYAHSHQRWKEVRPRARIRCGAVGPAKLEGRVGTGVCVEIKIGFFCSFWERSKYGNIKPQHPVPFCLVRPKKKSDRFTLNENALPLLLLRGD